MSQALGKQRLSPLAAAGIFLAIAAVVAVAVIARLKHDPTGKAGSPEYAYDTQRQVDPSLLGWRETGRFAGGLKSAGAIAVGPRVWTGTDLRPAPPREAVYLGGDRQICLFEPDGTLFKEVAANGPVKSLAVAPDGTIYAAMADHVEVYGPAKDQQSVWPSPSAGTLLTSIAVSPDGRVAVSDWGHRRVLLYDRQGKLLQSIGEKLNPDGGPVFTVPSPCFDVAFDRLGRLRVADTGRLRVEAFNAEGTLVDWFGKAGIAESDFCGCCNPAAFAVMPDGRFVTAEKGPVESQLIKVFDADGKFVNIVAGPDQLQSAGDWDGSEEYGGVDLAAGVGKVYVLQRRTGNVRVFQPR